MNINNISILKHILPLEVNYRIRRIGQIVKQETPKFEAYAENAKKRVFFLDAPAYANIGDQAIAYAMERFMKKYFPEYEQFEIQEDILPHYTKWLKKNIRTDDLICLTGGGNMGVMYQSYEATRRYILRLFKNNSIIIFPQTFDYGTSKYGQKEMKRSMKVYNSCANLVMCGRDIESYKKMKEVYPHVTVIYSPDIVLSLDIYGSESKNKSGIGICIRDDEESILDKNTKALIKKEYSNVKELTTIDSGNERIIGEKREEKIMEVLKTFASCEKIITDRLHGTIFAFVTNTPCVALPNSNGKVERLCATLSEYGGVFFTNKYQVGIECPKRSNAELNGEFNELINSIKNEIRC